jgi:hypothetical protein
MAEKQQYVVGWSVMEIIEAESFEDAEAYARDGAMDDLKSGTNIVNLSNIVNTETREQVSWDLGGTKTHSRKEE